MEAAMTLQTTARPSEEKATEEFLSGKLAQVDIAKIEKEIHALWQSAAQGEGEHPANSVTRACALNFILYSEDEGSEQAAGDLLDDITVRHPCRAILAILKPGKTASLEAWVSARCHITDVKSRKQICCEQITVRGEAVGTPELASVVLPLIVSDLPVILWWHPTQLAFDKLVPFLNAVDKLIVDSGCSADNFQFFRELLKIISQKPDVSERKLLCTDLNWRRSLPWREAVALAFDRSHSEISPDYLCGISSVEVRYGLPEETAGSQSISSGLMNQALLVVGWLSSTLKWRPESARMESGATAVLSFGGATGKVSVKLIGVPSAEAGIGDIGSIKIRCEKPTALMITAVQQKSMPGIGVSCSDCNSEQADSSLSSMFELNEAPEGHLIDKELESLRMEPSLKPAVEAVVQILGQLSKVGVKS
jgi:glucose-6-phosphate dehydrogenase assembly protein OpcA